MGRRALRKIDPRLDLSGHLKTFDELPVPFDSARLFERAGPVEVEIGCGKGLFLETAAAAVPDHNFLGVEVARKYAHYCAARLAKRALANAVIVHGDATRVLREALPDDSVAAVHVYFPDPWWKKRHHKRRVMNPQLLADVERVLAVNGRLHFWTDVEEYFQLSLEVIDQHTRLERLDRSEWPAAANELGYWTHFERRTRLSGLPVFRALFQQGPLPAPLPSAAG